MKRKTRKELPSEEVKDVVAEEIIAAKHPLCSHPDLKTQPPRHDPTTPYYPNLGPTC